MANYKIIYFFILLIFFSCSGKSYKYEIEGYSNHIIDNQHVRIKTIVYTDTISGMNEDSIWCYNTNKSKIILYKPYKIYK